MIEAIVADAELDLRAFSALLNQQSIMHRISASSQGQTIWLNDPTYLNEVKSIFAAWEAGEMTIELTKASPQQKQNRQDVKTLVRQIPITLSLIVLCAVIFFWTDFGFDAQKAVLLTFLKGQVIGSYIHFESLADTLANGQFWRLFTPVLLHFGWMHLVFNMLWLYEFGRRIEKAKGHGFILGLILISAVGSNLSQFCFAPNSALFGGFSGVIYALLGFIFSHQKLSFNPEFIMPAGIFWFMLVWMGIGFLGILDAWVRMANLAHASGFIIGSLLGLSAGFYHRYKQHLKER